MCIFREDNEGDYTLIVSNIHINHNQDSVW